jgi:hypothetical protein
VAADLAATLARIVRLPGDSDPPQATPPWRILLRALPDDGDPPQSPTHGGSRKNAKSSKQFIYFIKLRKIDDFHKKLTKRMIFP